MLLPREVSIGLDNDSNLIIGKFLHFQVDQNTFYFKNLEFKKSLL